MTRFGVLIGVFKRSILIQGNNRPLVVAKLVKINRMLCMCVIALSIVSAMVNLVLHNP